MTIEDYDIVGSYNNQRVSSIDAERSINLFEYQDPLGKKKKSLIPTSGLDNSLISFGAASGGFRTSFLFNGVTYHVIGNSVYSLTQNGTSFDAELLNANVPLTTSSGYVGIDANTYQVIFVDGVKGYIYDTILKQFFNISDFSFPAEPLDVCNLDGYFVVVNGGTPNFQLSALNNGMLWGPSANSYTTNSAGGDHNDFFIGNSTLTGGPSGTQNYRTGTPVMLSFTGGGSFSTTTPQINNTDVFYTITVFTGGLPDPQKIQIATSLANARAGIAVTISADGSNQVITSLGQLQQGSITTHPGNIIACRTLHRKLFLFSSFFTEVWENQGASANLPFRRSNSILIEYGALAAGNIATGFDYMYFISQSRDGLGAVMQVSGTEATSVSTRALDFQLAQYAAAGQIADCRAFLIKENGIIFYRMNFTSANHTFVYNVTQSSPMADATKYWHEEEVLNGDRHPSQTHVFYNGVNYVGHYTMPILYIVDSQESTNDGESIRRVRIPRPVVPAGYQRIRINRFQVDLLQGNTETLDFDNVDILLEDGFNNLQTENNFDLLTDQTEPINQDIDPVVFLSISKDGSQTYGNLITAPMGKSGERTFRTVWRKLGTTKRGQSFQPMIQFFNQMPFVVMGASWDYEILPE